MYLLWWILLGATLGKKRKKQVHQPNKASDNQKPTNDRRLDSPVIQPVRVEPASDDQAKNSNGKSYPERQITIAKWLNWITAFGAAGAIIYAGITYRQWRDSNRNFSVTQRAWIKVDAGFPDKEPPVYGVVMRVENVGKIVARNVHLIGRLEYDPADVGPNLGLHDVAATDITYGLVFPADHHDYPMQFTDNKAKPRALNSDELKQLALGNAYLSLFGIVAYEDEFGKHWTKFCHWHDYAMIQGPAVSARDCILWNRVGDGDPPTR